MEVIIIPDDPKLKNESGADPFHPDDFREAARQVIRAYIGQKHKLWLELADLLGKVQEGCSAPAKDIIKQELREASNIVMAVWWRF